MHNFCTSSERIIGYPATDWISAAGPVRRPLTPHAVRKVSSHARRIDRRPTRTPPNRNAWRISPLTSSTSSAFSALSALSVFRLSALSALADSAFFQRRAQDVAQRGAGIGGAILRHRLLLLGDLHRLDREIGLLRAVEADHLGIELLPHLEALGALLVAVAAKVGALDEAGRAVVADLDVEPAVADVADGDGERRRPC